MEEIKNKKFGKTVKETADFVVFTYVVIIAIKGLSDMAVDTKNFFRDRKANKSIKEQ